MNLAIIEKMVQSGDMSSDALRYLINCKGECEWLDFKENITLDHNKSSADFVRDVLAMKNTGGGYIVIGVKDKTWEVCGLPSKLSYDSKLLRDKVRSISGLDLDVDIINHEIFIDGSNKNLSIIFIRSSRNRRKRRTPSLVKNDFMPRESYGLRRGEIYVRRGDSTVRVQDEKELEDLLFELEQQTDGESLANRSSHFAVEHGLYRLLEKGFENYIGREDSRQKLVEAILKDPRIWIINVHGPGGVGKSAIVNWAIYDLFENKKFESIIHLTAKETILTTKGIERHTRTLYSLENLLDNILIVFEEDINLSLEQKKNNVIEILSAWTTLIVLDNMETVQDARIMNFVQNLPPTTKAKVLLTSRQKSGGWEMPFPLNELRENDFIDFLKKRSEELNVSLDITNNKLVGDIWTATGGLPLAIQWILGKYKVTGNLSNIIAEAKSSEAPILEFSFRNIWSVLSPDAKRILAVMSVFENPPTLQNISVATGYSLEKIETSIQELIECTLVNRQTQLSDGKVIFLALPITLSFAQNQLSDMGDFEIKCRQRLQVFQDQMKLHEIEVYKFQNRFEKFGITDENEKRAAILCQRGESEMFIGNADSAELLFKQARELSPNSSYVYAMSASYELARNRIGIALSFIEEACRRVNNKSGALCYSIKARILYAQKDNEKMSKALEKAIEFSPNDNVLRHQYGVALSKIGRKRDAILEFTHIINSEIKNSIPTPQLLMAYKTRMINYRSLNDMENLNKDRVAVNKIFKSNPHLISEAHSFVNLL